MKRALAHKRYLTGDAGHGFGYRCECGARNIGVRYVERGDAVLALRADCHVAEGIVSRRRRVEERDEAPRDEGITNTIECRVRLPASWGAKT